MSGQCAEKLMNAGNKEIEFVKVFTRYPGGRFRQEGQYSGEEFREDILKPALVTYDTIVLNLNGANGFPSSFIDEAFGGLVDDLGLGTVNKKLRIVVDDDPVTEAEIRKCMVEHASKR